MADGNVSFDGEAHRQINGRICWKITQNYCNVHTTQQNSNPRHDPVKAAVALYRHTKVRVSNLHTRAIDEPDENSVQPPVQLIFGAIQVRIVLEGKNKVEQQEYHVHNGQEEQVHVGGTSHPTPVNEEIG